MTAPTLNRDDKDLVERGRAEIKSLNTKMDEITASGWRDADGGLHVKAGADTEFKSLLDKAEGIHTQIGLLERKHRLDDYLDEPAGSPSDGSTIPAQRGDGGMETKTLGQRFVESKAFAGRRDSGRMDEAFDVNDVEITAEYKDLHSGSIGVTQHPGFGTVHRAPMVQAPMLTWRVRDLFPQMSTNSVMIEYIEEQGFVQPGDLAAGPVPEREGTAPNDTFGLKPRSNIRFDLKTTPIRTLAHWIPASRNVLDDEPQLRGIVDTRLLYGLRLVEDEEILLGDGTGNHLLGIFNTPGIQLFPGGAYTPPTNESKVDAIRRAATRVMLAQYDPTGIVVHPYDWEEMELTKDTQGRYLVSGSVVVGAEKRLWQMPVVATPACPQGSALVGAFGLGAQVFDRMQSNIRTADQHEDFFVRNAIVVLAEQRLGLAVYRPASMVRVSLEDAI